MRNWGEHIPHPSIVRLDIHPRAIIGDCRRRRTIDHAVPGAQEMRSGRDVGVEQVLGHFRTRFHRDRYADINSARQPNYD